MEKLKGILKSRKFWAAAAGIIVTVVKAYDPKFPLSEEQVTVIVGLLAAYIVGTGLEADRRNADLPPGLEADRRNADLPPGLDQGIKS
jgi:hypothetical protein